MTAGKRETSDIDYSFQGAPFPSPLEELQAVYRRKVETLKNLGEESRAGALESAYHLARSRLDSLLGSDD